MTTRITGKNLVITFDGTDISADYRTFDTSEEIGLVDVTAGADDAASYAMTFSDGSATYKGLYNADNVSSILSVLDKGHSGDLVWYPEGNTSGKPVWSVPAIVKSRSISYPFDGVVEVTAEFQFNGAAPTISTVA